MDILNEIEYDHIKWMLKKEQFRFQYAVIEKGQYIIEKRQVSLCGLEAFKPSPEYLLNNNPFSVRSQ